MNRAEKVSEISKGLARAHERNLESLVENLLSRLIVKDRGDLEEDFLCRQISEEWRVSGRAEWTSNRASKLRRDTGYIGTFPSRDCEERCFDTEACRSVQNCIFRLPSLDIILLICSVSISATQS